MRNAMLAAIGVAALLASPTVAQSPRTPMPSNSTVSTNGHGSVPPYLAHESGPYGPALPGAQRWRGLRHPEMRHTIY